MYLQCNSAVDELLERWEQGGNVIGIIYFKVTLISGEINQWQRFSVVMHKQDTTGLLSLAA